MKKLPKFRSTSPAASFGDIRRHRCCCSPHLTREPVSLRLREGRRRRVNTQSERMAFLPNAQLLKVLHIKATQFLLNCVYLQLKTNNCQLIRGMAC